MVTRSIPGVLGILRSCHAKDKYADAFPKSKKQRTGQKPISPYPPDTQWNAHYDKVKEAMKMQSENGSLQRMENSFAY